MSAPMEDISDNAFRTLCFNHGADLTFTELIKLEGLAKKNESTWARLELKDDTPTMIQLLGVKEEQLKSFLSVFKPSKSFKGFNLNIGCPNPRIIYLGQGCAMIKRSKKVQKLVSMIQDHNYPASVKLRLGLNNFEKEKKAYLNLINAVDADFFVVHARHGGQSYSEPADYDVIPDCVATGKPIIANGSIDTKEKVELMKSIGVQGVMIGRAAVSDPSIFDKIKGNPTPSLAELKKEYIELSKKFNPPFRYLKNFMKHIGKGVNK